MELTEKNRTGDFILSLGNGTISLENVVLASGNLAAGTVLGQLTAGGEYVVLDPAAAATGAEVAAAILYDNTDASAGAAACVVVARQAELKAEALVWPAGISGPGKATAIGQLNDRSIVLR